MNKKLFPARMRRRARSSLRAALVWNGIRFRKLRGTTIAWSARNGGAVWRVEKLAGAPTPYLASMQVLHQDRAYSRWGENPRVALDSLCRYVRQHTLELQAALSSVQSLCP